MISSKIEAMKQQVIELERSRKNVNVPLHKPEGAQQDRFIAEEKRLYDKGQSVTELSKKLYFLKKELEDDLEKYKL